MGEWYTIGLQAGRNVAKKVDAFIKKQHKSDSIGDNFDPQKMKTLSNGSTMYMWYMKWDPYWFKDEKELVEILNSFADKNEDEDDAYKLVAVGDEGGRDDRGNEIGYDIFDGLYSDCDVTFPEDFETADDVVQIEQALRDSDKETSCDVIADITQGADTYKVFEDLAARYIGGTADFRKGMDAALSIATGFSMAEIAAKVSAA